MAWSDEDQNPSLYPTTYAPATSYSAGLGYDPLSSISTGASSSAMTTASTGSSAASESYADRLAAAAPTPTEARATGGALAHSVDFRQTGRRTTSAPPAKVPAAAAAYTDPYSTTGRALNPRLGVAIQQEASRLGIAPSTLAAVIGYETIGKFDPDIQGGAGGRYMGLIQFGPSERKTYGYRPGMSFEEQLFGPVHNYLVDRGVKPGHGIAEVYSIINAGSLKNGQPRWDKSDRPGWDVRRHIGEVSRSYAPKYAYLDAGSTAPAYAPDAAPTMVAGATPPEPRMNPRRGMAYAEEGAPITDAPFDEVIREEPAAAQPYTVQRGDTLSKIAGRLLGDPSRWQELAAANGIRDPNVIRPGQRIIVPQAGGSGPYVVQRGDTLGRIAARELGDQSRWPEIAQANRLRDPNRISPGQQLIIPGRGGSAPQASARPAMPNATAPGMPPVPRLRQSGVADVMNERPRTAAETLEAGPRLRPDRSAPAEDDLLTEEEIDELTMLPEARDLLADSEERGRLRRISPEQTTLSAEDEPDARLLSDTERATINQQLDALVERARQEGWHQYRVGPQGAPPARSNREQWFVDQAREAAKDGPRYTAEDALPMDYERPLEPEPEPMPEEEPADPRLLSPEERARIIQQLEEFDREMQEDRGFVPDMSGGERVSGYPDRLWSQPGFGQWMTGPAAGPPPSRAVPSRSMAANLANLPSLITDRQSSLGPPAFTASNGVRIWVR